MIGEIIDAAQGFQQIAATLKGKSPYFPDVISLEEGMVTYLSTKVRIERGGRWYAIHCLEAFDETWNIALPFRTTLADCCRRLMTEAHIIAHLYTADETILHEDLDRIQISEVERLGNLYNHPTP